MFKICVHDGSLEVIMPNARLHNRGLTKSLMIIAASNKFRRHLIYILISWLERIVVIQVERDFSNVQVDDEDVSIFFV